jgi:hypothetical protein
MIMVLTMLLAPLLTTAHSHQGSADGAADVSQVAPYFFQHITFLEVRAS